MSMATSSIFLDFNLPSATSWFYLSLLLAVALFFKFSRFLSVRNWDVLTLFLLVPGLLLRQEAASAPADPTDSERGGLQSPAPENGAPSAAGQRLLWLSYLWLLCGSAYFFARCLGDLGLVRRPTLHPNLNLGGLAWLAGALFVCLVAVAARRSGPQAEVLTSSAPLDKVRQCIVEAVSAAPGVVECILAALCHLSVVTALIVIGWRHFQDLHAGMAAGTFYLLLPYTALQITQWHHVLPVALMLWAVAAYRRPVLAGLLLGLASGLSYFPIVTLPVWLSFYWQRGTVRFVSGFVLTLGLSLLAIGLLFWLDGELAASVASALAHLLAQSAPDGFWTGVHWAYRIPVFIAYVGFMLTTFFWPRPKNLAHLLALSAALVIGIQFWFADKGGVYVLWYAPLLLLLVFRPNLSDRVPLPVSSVPDWVRRLGGRLLRLGKRVLSLPEPMANVQ
jgi:hypothetical protein